MSKYDELCSALSEQTHAERNYWQALQVRAGQIASGLWTYLEFPSKTYKDFDGKQSYSYVALTKPGEDKDCHYPQLPGSKGAIHFDLLITLEEEPGCFPKSKVRFSLNVGSTGETLRVWDNSGNIDVDVPIGSDGNEEVYAQIFDALKKHLSYRPAFRKE
ncbi:hypothetical protein F0170_07255 [Pseudomonas sp. MAFF 730085]|uniref:Uncharacterized protein n=1 Tax=Pseudomonas kitaguniensis TaxID=2607908 RepID=A0A5N7JQX9_9PSED|nr:hypothetical protein [Pseudomonas kitaguniensis]MPQ83797.1 hypothetical protein [Pseudomonas kitaguniensis]